MTTDPAALFRAAAERTVTDPWCVTEVAGDLRPILSDWLEHAAKSHEATVTAAAQIWGSVDHPEAADFIRKMSHTHALATARLLLGDIAASELEETKTLLRAESQRANDAIDREEATEEYARELEAERDGAYRERAQLLAWLALTVPAVITPASDMDVPDWQLLYLNAPCGQLSWHISPRDAELFHHVKRVAADDPRAQWDGHTTDEKYQRIRGAIDTAASEQARSEEVEAIGRLSALADRLDADARQQHPDAVHPVAAHIRAAIKAPATAEG